MPSIQIDDSGVRAALAELQARIGSLPVRTVGLIGQDLVQAIRLDLREKVSPWGDPRKPIKWRRGKRAKLSDVPLRDTNQHIFNRLNLRNIPGGIEIGILDSENARIGRIHQFGATIQRETRKQTLNFKVNFKTGKSRFAKKSKSNFAQDVKIKSHSIIIPARPYLPIRPDNTVDLPQAWVDQMRKTIEEVIK